MESNLLSFCSVVETQALLVRGSMMSGSWTFLRLPQVNALGKGWRQRERLQSLEAMQLLPALSDRVCTSLEAGIFMVCIQDSAEENGVEHDFLIPAYKHITKRWLPLLSTKEQLSPS